MTTRRIIGLSLVATAAMWFQVAGQFEASRIDAQREARLAARTQAARLRVDSERLMSAVTTLADPKFEAGPLVRRVALPRARGFSSVTRPSAFTRCRAVTCFHSSSRASR